MSSRKRPPKSTRRLRSLLFGLRWRIRAYVVVEGLALAVVWLGITFWLGLALDYLPVLAGASEMPRLARAILLTVIGIVFIAILIRWVFQRVLRRMSDESMALLLERYHEQFHDSFVTAIAMGPQGDDMSVEGREMLTHSIDSALSSTDDVRLSRVFDGRPLKRKLAVALLMVLSIGGFSQLATEPFAIWIARLYRLEDSQWPRWADVGVVGLEVFALDAPRDGAGPPRRSSKLLTFVSSKARVARGANPKLILDADASRQVVPQYCQLFYDVVGGDRGRAKVARFRGQADGRQQYRIASEPLRGILETLEFNVLGYDCRTSDFTIEVFDSPEVTKAQIVHSPPDYLTDIERSIGFEQTTSYTAGLEIERGSRLTIVAESNRNLATVYLYDIDLDRTTTITVPHDRLRKIEIPVESLDRQMTFELLLVDTDGLISSQPYRMTIGMREDTPPVVNVTLDGIGSAITPIARIPVSGQISDDHGVDRAWFQLDVDDSTGLEYPIPLIGLGDVASEIDLREQRSSPDHKLELAAGQKLTLAIKANDKYDLEGGAHTGSSDYYQLDVVTPDQLLSILEVREVGLRRRFEQVLGEVVEMRDSLVRARPSSLSGVNTGAEPEDTLKTESTDEDSPADGEPVVEEVASEQLANPVRQLRVQRAIQRSSKSGQEIAGVAFSFNKIRDEIVNNRIDTQQRIERLEKQLVEPLTNLAQEMFPELDTRLEALEKGVDQPATLAMLTEAAIEQNEAILEEMRRIQQKMIEIEDFNSLIDLVRSMLEEQDKLIQETKKERVLELQ